MNLSSTELDDKFDLPRASSALGTAESSLGGMPKLGSVAACQLGVWQVQRDFVSALPFIILDVACVALAGAVVQGFETLAQTGSTVSTPIFVGCAMLLTIALHFMHGLYPACGMVYSIEYRRTLRSALIVLMALATALVLRRSGASNAFVSFSVFGATYLLLISSLRSVVRHVLARCDWWAQPVVIIGSNGEASALYERLDKCRNEGLRPLGIVFTPYEQAEIDDPQVSSRYLGPIDELERIMLGASTCRVAVADAAGFRWQDYHCFHGIPHVMMPTDLGGHPSERARLAERDGQIELHCHCMLTHPLALMIKRWLDLLFVVAASPIWLPVMAAIVVMMKITDPGPIFYRQERVGRFRRPFRALKFRSMVLNADQKLQRYLEKHPEMRAEWEATHKLQNDPRVTKIGAWLRRTSLDELPQLFNVLRGDMSLVGPRPIIDGGDYDREYIQEHPEVFELYQMVRPGITGLWQISGRNSLPYKQRVALDRYYLHNWSVTLDIFILWRTLKTALFREGAF